jgi:hypothetical protein
LLLCITVKKNKKKNKTKLKPERDDGYGTTKSPIAIARALAPLKVVKPVSIPYHEFSLEQLRANESFMTIAAHT